MAKTNARNLISVTKLLPAENSPGEGSDNENLYDNQQSAGNFVECIEKSSHSNSVACTDVWLKVW